MLLHFILIIITLMQLKDIIVQQIKDNGSMSFYDFMELALYHPEQGYYTSVNDRIGCNGDFYTSCTVSSLFAQMIGRQLEEMWVLLNKEPFTIIEYGAGMGQLCRDILNYLKNNEELYAHLNYYILEKSAAMREKEKKILNEKVQWIDSLADIAPINGCVLSNELLDNFAVHQVVMNEELMEVFIDYQNGFTEVLQPASDQLQLYFETLGIKLPQNYRTEVNTEATEWIKTITTHLQKGFVLTIDYGYHSEELYKDYRRNGTVVCYNKHTINEYPYQHIGMQDITAHVNFSALYVWGKKNGLDCNGYTDQATFLLSLGFNAAAMELLRKAGTQDITAYKKIQFVINALLVEMGSKMKVLIQQKGLPKCQLSGLHLARPNSEAILVPKTYSTFAMA